MDSNLVRNILSAGTAILTAVAMLAGTAEAQYFGRNKVDYEKFDFKVLRTEHFDIYFYPEEEVAVDYAARMAERWYARYSAILGDTLQGRQPLILYASGPQFRQTKVISGDLGEGTGGVTEPVKRRIVLPFAGPLAETDHVIGHELVHAFQFNMTGIGTPGASFGAPSAGRLPLWFVEGMAEYLSLGPIDPNTAMWMREASQKKLPKISELDSPEYFPYRYGQALLAYIGGRWGDKKLAQLLRVGGALGSIDTAIDSILSVTSDSLSKDWHSALHAAYDSVAHETSNPGAYGPELISEKSGGGSLNVSPVLSPDGGQLVFLSERDLFSIDIFLADATTGKVERNIFRAELDPHLQSIEFINSAGSWDPMGRRFLFSAVKKGRPLLTLLDVETGKVEREIPLPQLGEILNPAWSPDGRSIVFSALAGGVTDLFVYDLERNALERLTNDAYADLQPAWSPDGGKIAFATDRFTTDLSKLQTGNYRLAVLDMATRSIEPLPGFETGKNINPQWSPDGNSVYFLSDQNGITDIYRIEVATGKLSQVTSLYGGVSGITATSPALSTALRANRLVYSVYDQGKFKIYAIDSTSVLAGQSVSPPFATGNPAFLPPAHREDRPLLTYLDDPYLGLPQETDFSVTPYRAKLSLSGFSQPSIAAGVDRFGTYIGGGAALYWSDMLGNHNLVTGLQLQSGNGSTDVAGIVGYMNIAHRWNWGGVVQQIPYVTGGFAAGYGIVNGEPAYIEQQIIYRQINREISGLVSYPFNDVLRTEFFLGFRNISFRGNVTTRAVSLNTGLLIQDVTEDLPHPSAITLGSASAAIVYDHSFFGATSPILGERYRVEISPTVGSLYWTTLLADYRRYEMPLRPFTVAARVVHLGRYGKDSEDDRLAPLFIGYPGLVRGYDTGSFTVDEVVSESSGGVSIFDRLQGSKLLIANLELRFPLLGVLGIGKGYYGFLPIEVATFFDAGVAWQKGDEPTFFGGDRKPVSSVGVAIRFNLLGFAIGEADFVRPLDRPGKGWFWQFNLTEGF